MLDKGQLPNPTPAELDILGALWSKPGSTVREVHEALSPKTTGYTTVLKTLQIMFEKTLVTREQAGKAHRYFAAVKESSVKGRMLSEMVDRVFGGAAQKLVLQALQTRRPSAEELAEIRSLLDTYEEEGS